MKLEVLYMKSWWFIYRSSLINAKFGCSMSILFRRWESSLMREYLQSEIGWVLLASATSEFSGYIKFAYYSSAKGLQYV